MKKWLFPFVVLSLAVSCRHSISENCLVTYEMEGTIAEFRFMKDGEMKLFRESHIEAKLDTSFIQGIGSLLKVYGKGYQEPNDSGPEYRSLRARVLVDGREIMNEEDRSYDHNGYLEVRWRGRAR